MRILFSILGGALLVLMFFVLLSLIIPSSENAQGNVFTFKEDVELAYDKYEFTWDESKSTVTVIKTWKGKPSLDITVELTAQQDALLKSAYSKIDFTLIDPNSPTSTDGSWWYINNHGNSFKIRNPDYNVKQRNLESLYKLVKYIEKFSTIKKYGEINT
ncbi:MAG: hypothetical protein ACSHW0_09770 [Thalassotalea sp.]